MYLYVFICRYRYICIYKHMYICIYIGIDIHIYIYVYISICIYIHIYIYAHTQTHPHTRISQVLVMTYSWIIGQTDHSTHTYIHTQRDIQKYIRLTCYHTQRHLCVFACVCMCVCVRERVLFILVAYLHIVCVCVCVCVCTIVCVCSCVCLSYVRHASGCLPRSLSEWNHCSVPHMYRVAKTHRMLYLQRTFSAKEPYIWWLLCEKWPATFPTFCEIGHLLTLRSNFSCPRHGVPTTGPTNYSEPFSPFLFSLFFETRRLLILKSDFNVRSILWVFATLLRASHVADSVCVYIYWYLCAIYTHPLHPLHRRHACVTWVMPQIWMSHVPHVNESCPT